MMELLVTLSIAGLMLASMSSFFTGASASSREAGVQSEAGQGLRALFEMLSQELRQAGACLPNGGDFIALQGVDAGTLDSLTVRLGQTDPTTLACIMAGTVQAETSGASSVVVSAAEGGLFSVGDRLYITPNGATGAFHSITAKGSSGGGTELSLSPSLQGSHPVGSGVYAVDEREYAVATIGGSQMLTMAIDGGSAEPLIDKVEAFNVQYQLAPCTIDGCASTVDLPQDNAEWSLVRALVLDATVKSHKENKHGDFVYESSQIIVKPRNFL